MLVVGSKAMEVFLRRLPQIVESRSSNSELGASKTKNQKRFLLGFRHHPESA